MIAATLPLPPADIVRGTEHLYRVETVSAIQDAAYAAGWDAALEALGQRVRRMKEGGQ